MRRLDFSNVSIRGRDLRGLSGYQGKPFHPPLTDVPIGAYVIAPVLDVIAFFGRGASWAESLSKAAGIVLLVGAVFSIATVVTGFADWLTTEKGSKVRRTANAHAWTMVVMSLAVAFSLVYRYFILNEPQTDVILLLTALGIAALAGIGGTLGGSLVYDYGFNVENSKDHPAYHAGGQEGSG